MNNFQTIFKSFLPIKHVLEVKAVKKKVRNRDKGIYYWLSNKYSNSKNTDSEK